MSTTTSPSERQKLNERALGGLGRAFRVGFVGGHDRVEREVVSFGSELGLDVEVHNGCTAGQGRHRLVALVERTDLVVIVTGINSHNAVHIAKRTAAKARTHVRILKACGSGTARLLLAEIASAGRGSQLCDRGD
jgi:hypothetical protein